MQNNTVWISYPAIDIMCRLFLKICWSRCLTGWMTEIKDFSSGMRMCTQHLNYVGQQQKVKW